MPWWLAIGLVAVGILIGHFVIPYHADTPRLVP